MSITAAMVKELRERTGAGMMECKNALKEADGDMETAVETLRKKGAAKADKKAGRIAAEGVVALAIADDAASGALVEINCETDFVAKDENFRRFAQAVAETILEHRPAELAALQELTLSGSDQTTEQARVELFTKIGENLSIRRFQSIDAGAGGRIGGYSHGARIGVLVAIQGGTQELARDLAMHVAASNPLCVSVDQVPADTLEKERQVQLAQAADSGKPADIVEKIVDGRIKKYLNEVTLLGQPFVKDPDLRVGDLLKNAGASVTRFLRYEVGEGIEKRDDDFVAEVMSQAKGA